MKRRVGVPTLLSGPRSLGKVRDSSTSVGMTGMEGGAEGAGSTFGHRSAGEQQRGYRRAMTISPGSW